MNESDLFIQLMPGGGWTAIYRHDDGVEFKTPVVAWALTADGEIHALDVDGVGVVEIVATTTNFVRIEGPSPTCT